MFDVFFVVYNLLDVNSLVEHGGEGRESVRFSSILASESYN